jgi:hypothetical protein
MIEVVTGVLKKKKIKESAIKFDTSSHENVIQRRIARKFSLW